MINMPISSQANEFIALEKLNQWVCQTEEPFGSFLKKLWLDIEYLNENEHLSKVLVPFFSSIDFTLYTNNELVIKLLEKADFEWHNKYLEHYQNVLGQLIEQDQMGMARSLIKLLIKTKVGINDDFLEQKLKSSSISEIVKLELKLLNLIRNKAMGNQQMIEVIEKKAQKITENSSSSAEIQRAIYQLPILGFLWHENKPKDFLYKCISVSLRSPENEQIDNRLQEHLELYLKNALLDLCKRKAWNVIERSLATNYGWFTKMIEHVFEYPSMESYYLEFEKTKQQAQKKILHKSIKETKGMMDFLAKEN